MSREQQRAAISELITDVLRQTLIALEEALAREKAAAHAGMPPPALREQAREELVGRVLHALEGLLRQHGGSDQECLRLILESLAATAMGHQEPEVEADPWRKVVDSLGTAIRNLR